MRAHLVALALVPPLVACRPAEQPARPRPAGGSVRCAFNRVGAVIVRGAPRELVPALTVLEGTLDDPARTQRIAAVATRGLIAQGYAGAAIAVAHRPGAGRGACIELDVRVAPGPRYRIARIAFETDEPHDRAFPPAERLAALEDALGTVNTIGGVYIAYRMTRALAELERRYHDAGWLDARLGAPRVTYDPGGAIDLAIPVAAGRRFRIARVTATGAGPGARAAVLDSLDLRPGDYYDGPRIRTAIARARHALARRVELRTRIAHDRPEIEVEAIVEAPR